MGEIKRTIERMGSPIIILLLCTLTGRASNPVIQDPQTVAVPIRTRVVVAAPKDLYSNTVLVDEPALLEVVEEVRLNDRLVIARNAVARARVKTAKPPASFGRGGELVLEFEEVEAVDGRKIALGGEHRVKGEGRGAAAAGFWILLGPLGGRYQEGKPARIKAGEKMAAITAAEVTIEVKP